MILYIKKSKGEVRLSRPIWPVNDTILYYTIYHSLFVKLVIAWMGKISFNTIFESTVICNSKSFQHSTSH